MADQLRDHLRRVDGSAPAIQSAANAMMKHYDRSAAVAVTEWRNVLQTASIDQILPLLYVANEVLQTSKRNRGNKFLEAFSPVLGQSLVHMARQLRTCTEKIRRTVKIWGDRRVFSIRFVNDLLAGLEPYRETTAATPSNSSSDRLAAEEEDSKPFTTTDDDDGATFSPITATPATPAATTLSETTTAEETTTVTATSHDEIMDILEAHYMGGADEEDDMFADNSERQKLEIDISLDAAVQDSPVRIQKRRRSSASHGSSSHGNKKRNKILSISYLLELWTQLAENQQKFDLAQHALTRIADNIQSTPDDDLSNLVGDALQQAVQQNEADLRTMAKQKHLLHALANERRSLEVEAVRYLPWLEAALQHDDDDLEFCQVLREKIGQFQPIHARLSVTRSAMREEERLHAQQEAEVERQRREAAENEQFRQAALAMETEAKPGMRWNAATREYQALNTDESWRD